MSWDAPELCWQFLVGDEQLELTRGIVERARHRGQLRVAEMNQQTADNLLTIITTLEKPQVATDSDGSDAG
jgi:hypothetical protein